MESSSLQIKIKRIYEPPDGNDGARILVDRLWPRGILKEHAKLDGWNKDAAPTTALRKWFNHDPAKWDEFKARYTAELEEKQQILSALLGQARHNRLTLLYAAHDQTYNHARVLQAFLQGITINRITG